MRQKGGVIMANTTNVMKLLGKITECGLTKDAFAKVINMDYSTLWRKLKNDGESFTIREANLIAKELSLTSDEAMSIFFTNLVA